MLFLEAFRQIQCAAKFNSLLAHSPWSVYVKPNQKSREVKGQEILRASPPYWKAFSSRNEIEIINREENMNIFDLHK